MVTMAYDTIQCDTTLTLYNVYYTIHWHTVYKTIGRDTTTDATNYCSELFY